MPAAGLRLLVLLVLLVTALATEAQGDKMHRLGVLMPGARAAPSVATTASVLPAVLRELGYLEGRNLVLEQRFADGELERLPALARELVQRGVDVIVAPSPVAVDAAKQATATIPIVMLLAYSDPVAHGFVTSFARPGGNVTGVVLAAELSIAGKRLELLKEAVPSARRIAVLSTREATSRTQVQWVEKAAATLGVTPVVVEVRDGDYDRAFTRIAAERAEALFIVASTILHIDQVRIMRLAAKHRLPTISDWREHVEAGGLLAYGGSATGFTRRAAAYVDQILKGARPADLPVERANILELAISLRTARTLGLTVPASLLARADHVLE